MTEYKGIDIALMWSATKAKAVLAEEARKNALFEAAFLPLAEFAASPRLKGIATKEGKPIKITAFPKSDVRNYKHPHVQIEVPVPTRDRNSREVTIKCDLNYDGQPYYYAYGDILDSPCRRHGDSSSNRDPLVVIDHVMSKVFEYVSPNALASL